MHKRRGRVISKAKNISRRAGALLLAGTVLGGSATQSLAQTTPAAQQPQPAATQPATSQPAPPPAPVAAPVTHTIRSIAVRGNQRLEPETIRSYANLAPGQTYTAETLDQALKDLYATQLFADVNISAPKPATWSSTFARTR
jgi:outer membrane protein insertion porin family